MVVILRFFMFILVHFNEVAVTALCDVYLQNNHVDVLFDNFIYIIMNVR